MFPRGGGRGERGGGRVAQTQCVLLRVHLYAKRTEASRPNFGEGREEPHIGGPNTRRVLLRVHLYAKRTEASRPKFGVGEGRESRVKAKGEG